MTTPATDRPTVEDAGVDHDGDRAAIAAIIANVETAFNANDAEALLGDVARNALIGNAVGGITRGFAEALESSRAGLEGVLRDEYARYELTDVVFLRPDVALALKSARAVSADGAPIDTDPSMVALYVLAKQQNRWWIVARQNTPVPPWASTR